MKMAESKKMKKCKSKRKASEMEEELGFGEDVIAGKHKQKKKKDDVKITQQDQEIEFTVTVGTKKKHKNKHAHIATSAGVGLVEESHFIKKKKKHKKNKEQRNLTEIEENGEGRECGPDSGLDVQLTDAKNNKKKHRKHALHDTEGGSCDMELTEERTHKKKKHKKCVVEETEAVVKTHRLSAGSERNGEGEKLNSTHKKKKHKKRVKDELADESANEAEHIKKHKRSNESIDLGSVEITINEGEMKKKRKRERSPVSVQLDTSPAQSDVKRSKKEKKHKECEAKKKRKHEGGNDQSVVASPDRDDTVVQEVSRSHATKQINDTTPGGGNRRFLGQWGTAELATDDRQSKFFRLLGGFKAGSGQKAATGACFNSALTADKETLLNKTLETQFDTALSYTINKQRGGGLGYAAPPGENKKFHIDTASSKSIKFDD